MDSLWASINGGSDNNITAKTLTFRELASATKNFRAECLLGEGGFGRVYKGYLESINQVSHLLSIETLYGRSTEHSEWIKLSSHVLHSSASIYIFLAILFPGF